MTPKDKAKELVEKFYMFTWMAVKASSNVDAKQCALIAVDELIEAFKQLSISESGRVYIDFGHGYWEEVKQEIEKL